MNIFLADEIKEQYKNWGPGDIIFITAPTGTGKSHFILHVYLKWLIERRIAQGGEGIISYPRQILYLVNRTILQKQIKEELSKEIEPELDAYLGEPINIGDYISIRTYQSIETALLTEDPLEVVNEFKKYECVVCDEAHYFYADANFNTNTELSYDCIRTVFNHKIQIYMSATLDHVESIIKQRKAKYLPYDIEYTYTMPDEVGISFGATDRFYKYETKSLSKYELQPPIEDFDDLIKRIKSSENEKWLIFVDSIENGEKLQRDIAKKMAEKMAENDIVFIDAKYRRHEKSVDSVEEIVSKKYTAKKILIATAVMDNGISLHDKKLKNIVLMVDTQEEFIQMLGRKRQDFETVKIYVCSRDKKYFQSRLEYQKKIIQSYKKIKKCVQGMYIRTFDMEGCVKDNFYEGSKSEIGENERKFTYEDAVKKCCEEDYYYKKGEIIKQEVTPYLDLINRNHPVISVKEGELKKCYWNTFNYEKILSYQQIVLNSLLAGKHDAEELKKICYSVNGILAVNHFSVQRCLDLQVFYKIMIAQLESNGNAFVEMQASWLGVDPKSAIAGREKRMREKILKILEEIKDMEDMEISAVQNEWYFKCLLREEMLYFLKGKVDDEELRTIKKRKGYKATQSFEEWKTQNETPTPMNEKYINLVLSNIEAPYTVKKEKGSWRLVPLKSQ